MKNLREAQSHVHGRLTSRQLSARAWQDFDDLFARHNGVWGGCWCMFFHAPGKFVSGAYEANRKAKKRLVLQGRAHGIIVYCAGRPVVWCQFGPREELARIDSKRGYVPTSRDAWRITCLFVAKDHRRLGVARHAARSAVEAMRRCGVSSVEAYPVDGLKSATLLWSGAPELFEELGFERVAPLGRSSSIYSLRLDSARTY